MMIKLSCRTLARAATIAGLLGLTPAHAGDEGWKSLFDGESLNGWIPKFAGLPLGENYKNTFQAKNGILSVVYDDYDQFEGRFGHIFYHVPYSHYRLRFEYRFHGKQTAGAPGWAFRNSGVMVHSQAPETMAVDQDFPVSVEVQLLGQEGADKRATGNLCTPGTQVVVAGQPVMSDQCVDSSSPTFAGDGWVKAEVVVKGGALVEHWIEGERVLEYGALRYDPSAADTARLGVGAVPLTSGYISFQAESHPVDFRNIELQVIDADQKD